MSTSIVQVHEVADTYAKALRGLDALCEALNSISDERGGLGDFTEPDLFAELEGSRYQEQALECWADYGHLRNEWEEHPSGLAGWWLEQQLEIVFIGRKTLGSTRYESYDDYQASAVEVVLGLGGPTVRLTFDLSGEYAKLFVAWESNWTIELYVPYLREAVLGLAEMMGEY